MMMSRLALTLLLATQWTNGSEVLHSHPQQQAQVPIQQQYARNTDEVVNTAETSIIDNGVIMLGLNNEGHLHAEGGVPDGHSAITTVGLRYFRDGDWYESTAHGLKAEGFGVSAKYNSSGIEFWGGANAHTGIDNFEPGPLTSDGTSAYAYGNVGPDLQVTHEWEPAEETPNLYKVLVSLENLHPTDTLTELRYRRVIDWDIPPTIYNECVSLFYQGDSPTSLEYASDDGFASVNPLDALSGIEFLCPRPNGDDPCPVYDSGPKDHGAVFQFLLKEKFSSELIELKPLEQYQFHFYLGAASTKAEAYEALNKVGAEIASFGAPSIGGVCSEEADGSPNVFMVGFKGVGGSRIVPPGTPTPDPTTSPSITSSSKKVSVKYYSFSRTSLPYYGFEDSMVSYKSDSVATIDFPQTSGDFATSGKDNYVAAVFTGYVRLPLDGEYTFCLLSDDGSKLFIDGEIMINHDGLHSTSSKCETVTASADEVYFFEVQYFEHEGDATLILEVLMPGSDTRVPMPVEAWVDIDIYETSPPSVTPLPDDPTPSPSSSPSETISTDPPTASPSSSPSNKPVLTSTIINNGLVMLGVHDEGQLNAPGGEPDGHNDITLVGLRFYRDGEWYESTSFGSPAEGFGVSASRVSDGIDIWGSANQNSGVVNLVPEEMKSDGVSASTNALVEGDTNLLINHFFTPSESSKNLYQVKVTIDNLSDEVLTNLRYRRVIDWDIPPSTFYECVSLFHSKDDRPTSLEYATDNGFLPTNPLNDVSGDDVFSCPDGSCPVFDSVPSDRGALFQFLFKDEFENPINLAPGESFSFDMFYGAAPTKAVADEALESVGAEIASYGYPPTEFGCNKDNPGSPNVFILGFSGVGGSVITPYPPTPSPTPNPTTSPTVVPEKKVFVEYYEFMYESLAYPYDGFEGLEPYKTDYVATIDFPQTFGDFATSDLNNYVGAKFTGYTQPPMDGEYTFCLVSDDGSRFFIDGELVIDHDGLHSTTSACAIVEAEAEKVYKFEVEYFEEIGGATLILEMALPGSKDTDPFPADAWIDAPDVLPTPSPSSSPTMSPTMSPTNFPPAEDGSFQIVSTYPSSVDMCIQPDSYSDEASLVVKICDGSSVQKWDADEFGRISAASMPYMCITVGPFDYLVMDYCGSTESKKNTFMYDLFQETLVWKEDSTKVFTIASMTPEEDDRILLTDRDRSVLVQEWKLD